MSCNSHLSIDVKGLSGEPAAWEAWACEIYERQWYRLYANMAGVRNDDGVVPVAEGRGLPEEVSSGSQSFHWGIGGHSMTWLTPDEYGLAFNRAEHTTPFGSEHYREWKALNLVLIALEEIYGEGNVRLIVSFDN